MKKTANTDKYQYVKVTDFSDKQGNAETILDYNPTQPNLNQTNLNPT